ncbi:MAG: peptide-methionine (S)-S-oxide reductase [Planctomycetaceae bacterium]|nr:MAG: peptide-methionine (S)-S-oxide reductase [Planctomycetaceae bacterium]
MRFRLRRLSARGRSAGDEPCNPVQPSGWWFLIATSASRARRLSTIFGLVWFHTHQKQEITVLRITLLAFLLTAGTTFDASRVAAQDRVLETATFGGGCYWCVEAVFQRIEGVEEVSPGFMGGRLPNPTYDQVLTGRSGHVEVVQIQFDPSTITFAKLLEVFWQTHDPTTKNRQGNDIGPQYRSVIFYHSANQKTEAEEFKRRLNRGRVFPSPIVTAIEKASDFYLAKEDHRDYYNRNPDKQYCQLVIGPKLKKLKEVFGDRLKASDSSENLPK